MTKRKLFSMLTPVFAVIGLVAVVCLLYRANKYNLANNRKWGYLKTLWMEIQYFFNLTSL